MVVLEGMVCGVPVVAYNLPPYREFFTQGMVRVNLGDTTQFSKLVLCLLRDHEYYLSLSKDAHKHSMNYSWDRLFDSIHSHV